MLITLLTLLWKKQALFQLSRPIQTKVIRLLVTEIFFNKTTEKSTCSVQDLKEFLVQLWQAIESVIVGLDG